MSNGRDLTGNRSSTQSATIVKKPETNSIYFIFTIDKQARSNGLRYSEVDMGLQGGLGNINSNKNIAISTPTCEKVTIIKHCNNTDFWIITHLYGSNTFHSYLLTAAGLNTTPIISNIGSIISEITNNANTIGYLKGSTDGSRIAIANRAMDNVELFDFDNTTGLLSNPITFNNFNPFGSYGIEFSPNSNLLYVSENSIPISNIYQYNLLAGSPTAIVNSRTIIGSQNGWSGAIQLAPDHKIYHARYLKDSLGVINKPNLTGVSCAYVANGFYLSERLSSFGLPNLYNFNYTPLPDIDIGNDTNICQGETLTLDATTSKATYLWQDSSTNPTFNVTEQGTYWVEVTTACKTSSDTAIVNLTPLPTVDLGNDTTICQGETLTLNATTPTATYLWQNSTTTPTSNTTQQGPYWVKVTVNNCSKIDTIYVNYTPLPTVNLGNDTSICQGETLTLNATTPTATYLWQDDSTDPIFKVIQEGPYWTEITVNNCSTTKNINIDIEFCDCTLYLPNSFTPNSDKNNDQFSPLFDCDITEYSFLIFNRWGELFFETNMPTNSWDGNFKGEVCPTGVYVYFIKYKYKGSPKKEYGQVNLFK
jgi:gliding motility-associated-like protein